MATSPLLSDLTAKAYAKAPIGDVESYDKKLAVTQSYFRPDMNVMEFGCGPGTTAVHHAPHVRHITAYDISTKMLEIAQQRADEAGADNISFEIGDIVDLQIENETYDVIMGHSILHLLKNKEAVIAKVFAALRPGGLFVSSTVCLTQVGGVLRTVVQIIGKLPLMPPVQTFSKDDLRRAISNAGFAIDHDWTPSEEAALFLVAKKPGTAA